MKVTKGISYLFVLLFFTGCVERYYPGADELFTGTLVINASITNIQGIQTIQISRSDDLVNPEFIPESSCMVEVENMSGENISFPNRSPDITMQNFPQGL